MKLISFLIAAILNTAAFAQVKIQLDIDNPAPRVGEKVELSVEMDFFGRELMNQLPANVEQEKRESYMPKQKDYFTKEVTFTEPGRYVLGPLKFEVNGVEYFTDSLEVHVAPVLPDEEGVWVRLVKTEDQMMVIVEQKLRQEQSTAEKKGAAKKPESNYQFNYSFGMENDNFAKIMRNPEKGIYFRAGNSHSSTDGSGYARSKKVYTVDFTSEFDGSFTLTEEHFENLPRGVKVGKLVIGREY